jgi:hypothetical protein
MTIFDLLLILVFLGSLLAILALGYFSLRQQWSRARRVLTGLLSVLVIYTVILLTVSLLSPQRVFAMHQKRCFDDWCISVEQVVQQSSVGVAPQTARAQGTFYLVTVQVSSQARGISQRALDVQAYLLDANNRRFDLSPVGQRALDSSGGGGLPLNSLLAPEGSFTRALVFDVPAGASSLSLAVTHGLFPDVLVIGSEQSFLHKPTIIQFRGQHSSMLPVHRSKIHHEV